MIGGRGYRSENGGAHPGGNGRLGVFAGPLRKRYQWMFMNGMKSMVFSLMTLNSPICAPVMLWQ